MDLPRSGLLDKLQAFLPQLDKANQNLTEEDIIDKDLVKAEPGDGEGEGEDSDDHDIDDDAADDDDTDVQPEEEGGSKQVALTFALGDFDEHPLAVMDEEKEAHATGQAGAVVKDSKDEGEGEEQGGTSKLFNVPPKEEEKGQKTKKRPLIQEMG